MIFISSALNGIFAGTNFGGSPAQRFCRHVDTAPEASTGRSPIHRVSRSTGGLLTSRVCLRCLACVSHAGTVWNVMRTHTNEICSQRSPRRHLSWRYPQKGTPMAKTGKPSPWAARYVPLGHIRFGYRPIRGPRPTRGYRHSEPSGYFVGADASYRTTLKRPHAHDICVTAIVISHKWPILGVPPSIVFGYRCRTEPVAGPAAGIVPRRRIERPLSENRCVSASGMRFSAAAPSPSTLVRPC